MRKYLSRIIHVWQQIAVYYLVTSLPFVALAQIELNCSSVFQKSGNAGQIELVVPNIQGAIGDSYEPIYVPSGRTVGNKNTRSLDQCGSSECYLFAFLGAIEVKNYNNRLDEKAPQFSGVYLFAQKLLSYAKDIVWYGPENTYYKLKGGQAFDALQLIRNFGLIPESSWRPKLDFEKWDFASIYNTLSKKGIEWNNYINSIAKRYGRESENTKSAYFKGVNDLQSVILDHTGDLPTQVWLNNQLYSAKEVERQYGFDHKLMILMQYPNGKKNINEKQLQDRLYSATFPYGGGYKYGPADFVTIEKNIMKWVDSGSPVIIDLDWGTSSIGHSMVIVDYETQNGYLSSLKLKNSWGEDFGDRGYAWYSYQDIRLRLRNTWRFGYLSNANQRTH